MEDRMTSKLVVNTIEADTGISSVSFASSISMSSTSVFHFSDAGVNIGADTNISSLGNGILGFNINGSEMARIDSSGHIKVVGVVTATHFYGSGANLTGLTSPAISAIASDGANRVLTSDGDGTATAHSFVTIENNRLSVNRGSGSGAFPLIVRRTDASGIIAEFANSSGYGLLIGQNSATGEAYLRTGTGQPMVFTTNAGSGIANERMRLLSGGSLLIGRTTATSFGSLLQLKSIDVETDGDTTGMRFNRTDSNAAWVAMRFYAQGSQSGYIQINTSSTTYSTSSDYRLKENVVSISDGITRFNQLNPYRFNFKNDSSTTLDGFYAHEASEVVPESVVGTKDAVDSEGNIDPQGIDQSKLVPLLTAALQEAVTKIEILESKVATLEGS